MAVALKGANDSKSTNSIIARSMGMGKGQNVKKESAAANPGHNKAPKGSKSKLPPMPTAEAVQMGLPSALAALKANRDGPPKEDVPAPIIKSKTQPKKNEDDASGSDESDDDLGLDDENDDAITKFREKRMAELKQQNAKVQEFKQLGHGSYVEIKEDEFLPSVTKSKYVVCQFYHPHFERCKIVDKHLLLLSAQHVATKFIKLNAEKSPFFVEKLAIKTLPTIVLFKDGIAIDRIVGFEEFGGEDDFNTEIMANRIAKKGVIIIKKEKKETNGANNSIRSASNNDDKPDAAGEPNDDD